MANKKDIIGKKFGKLTAIEYKYVKKQKTFWLFKCACGRETVKRRSDVICGKIISCGCAWKFLGSERICSSCKNTKNNNEFYKRSGKRSNNYRSVCKECEKNGIKEYRKTEKGNIVSKKACNKYRNKNIKFVKQKNKEWRKNNKEYVNTKYMEEYYKNPRIRIRQTFSSLIRERLKKRNSSKEKKSMLDILPYNIKKLTERLEMNFKGGMTWDNYGKWHIDHIKPDCKFNYKSINDQSFKDCWSLANLQPLWAIDNLKKNKY